MQHWVATWAVRMWPVEEEADDEMAQVRTAAGRYQRTQGEMTRAREALHSAIRAALAAGLPIGQVAKESGFDREHVRRIRDGN